MKRYLIIIIAVTFIGTTVFLIFNSEPVSTQKGVKNHNQELLTIEQRINLGLQSGGIHPDLYDQIDDQLIEIERTNFEPERTKYLRNLMTQLQVGGRNSQKSVPQISPSPATPSVPKSTVMSSKTPLPILKSPSPSVAVTTAPSPIVSRPVPTCENNLNPVFTSYLIDPNSVTNIRPPPNVHKASGDLKTHSYIDTKNAGLPIYAPADMELIKGSHYIGGPYYFDFRVTCEVSLRLAHIIDPVKKIKDAFPAEPTQNAPEILLSIPIKFKAGELIAYSGGPPHVLNMGFDFGVYNSTKPNRYASTKTSSIYTTAVCPYDYFISSIKSEYQSKYDLIDHAGMTFDGESFCK